MLTPLELDKLPTAVEESMAAVETDILDDMARRIVKTDFFTESAQWELNRLQSYGLTQEEIFKHLSKQTGKTQKELRKMFKEAAELSFSADADIYETAGYKTVPLSKNKLLQNIINAGLVKTNNLFRNLTSTTAKTATQQFENALDSCYMQITSGAFDYNTAIRKTIVDLAHAGINSIRYPSGHTDKLDVATRRAALTGVNQTCARMQAALADEMDCDPVEVDAHPGARPSHAVWQGKIYSRSGKSDKYPNFVEATGYGTGAGLCGWNCRHSFYPYFEGDDQSYKASELKELNNRTVDYNGEQIGEYEATQKQRLAERKIRATKRELSSLDAAIKETDDDSLREELQSTFDRSSVKLKKQEAQLKDFLNQTGLRRERAREQVSAHFDTKQNKTVAFNKSVSQKAVYSAKNSILLESKNAQYAEYLTQLRKGEVILKNRQQIILDTLPKSGCFTRLKKKNVSLDDLAALSAKEHCEFAIFTKGKNRIIMRGDYKSCNIGATLADELLSEEWIWDGHSHPTITRLIPSDADVKALKLFTWQKNSSIIDLTGKTIVFTGDEQDRLNYILGVK